MDGGRAEAEGSFAQGKEIALSGRELCGALKIVAIGDPIGIVSVNCLVTTVRSEAENRKMMP